MPRSSQTTKNKLSRDFFKDHATKKRIDEHLSDINDTISEDDLRNIKTDIISPGDDTQENTKSEREPETGEEDDVHMENTEFDKKDKLISPWNILEEPS